MHVGERGREEERRRGREGKERQEKGRVGEEGGERRGPAERGGRERGCPLKRQQHSPYEFLCLLRDQSH